MGTSGAAAVEEHGVQLRKSKRMQLTTSDDGTKLRVDETTRMMVKGRR